MFRCCLMLVCAIVAVMENYVAAQNIYYYRPSSLSSRYRTVPAPKKSINSINSIDDDPFKSFNSLIKPYNPFANDRNRPAVQQQLQYRWKLDSIESDESDEVYRRFANPLASQPRRQPKSYFDSDSHESDEIYRRITKPTQKRTYYHSDSDESDENVYRRFVAPYRRF